MEEGAKDAPVLTHIQELVAEASPVRQGIARCFRKPATRHHPGRARPVLGPSAPAPRALRDRSRRKRGARAPARGGRKASWMILAAVQAFRPVTRRRAQEVRGVRRIQLRQFARRDFGDARKPLALASLEQRPRVGTAILSGTYAITGMGSDPCIQATNKHRVSLR
jgi:hypothetical protein